MKGHERTVIEPARCSILFKTIALAIYRSQGKGSTHTTVPTFYINHWDSLKLAQVAD